MKYFLSITISLKNMFFIILFLSVFTIQGAAFARGQNGLKIVAAVARNELSPDERAQAQAASNPTHASAAPTRITVASTPRPVKVLIISLFGPEGDAWHDLNLTEQITVPGLSPDYPAVKCNADDVCQLTTGMGHANAAASVMAMTFSGKFDLTRSYFLVAGIAGINPNVATIGSATWARYLVDFGLQHEIETRELPSGWSGAGYFGIHAKDANSAPKLDYRTEMFQLNEALLQWALALSSNVTLDDNDAARAYRSHYSQPTATAAPIVVQCDTEAGDTYWHGNILGERAEKWMSLLTNGKGRYCTTQQEDNAVFEALRRAESANLLSTQRVAVLRTASNFDRPYENQSAYDSLKSSSGAFGSALKNIYIAGAPFIHEIVANWQEWSVGPPQLQGALSHPNGQTN